MASGNGGRRTQGTFPRLLRRELCLARPLFVDFEGHTSFGGPRAVVAEKACRYAQETDYLEFAHFLQLCGTLALFQQKRNQVQICVASVTSRGLPWKAMRRRGREP